MSIKHSSNPITPNSKPLDAYAFLGLNLTLIININTHIMSYSNTRPITPNSTPFECLCFPCLNLTRTTNSNPGLNHVCVCIHAHTLQL